MRLRSVLRPLLVLAAAMLLVPVASHAATVSAGPGFPATTTTGFWDEALDGMFVPGSNLEYRTAIEYTGTAGDPATITDLSLVLTDADTSIGIEGQTPIIVSGPVGVTIGACVSADPGQPFSGSPIVGPSYACPITGSLEKGGVPLLVKITVRTTTANSYHLVGAGSSMTATKFGVLYPNPEGAPGDPRRLSMVSTGVGPVPSKNGSVLVVKGGFVVDGVPSIVSSYVSPLAGHPVPFRFKLSNDGTRSGNVTQSPAITPTIEARFPSAGFGAFEASDVSVTGMTATCTVTIDGSDRLVRCIATGDIASGASAIVTVTAPVLTGTSSAQVRFRATQPGTTPYPASQWSTSSSQTPDFRDTECNSSTAVHPTLGFTYSLGFLEGTGSPISGDLTCGAVLGDFYDAITITPDTVYPTPGGVHSGTLVVGNVDGPGYPTLTWTAAGPSVDAVDRYRLEMTRGSTTSCAIVFVYQGDPENVTPGATPAPTATSGVCKEGADPDPTCPVGQTGTPPNCVTPPAATCPTGQTGTPPNCVTPPATTCASGQTGTPPNCVTPKPADPTPTTCTTGEIGTPPNCIKPKAFVGGAGNKTYQGTAADDSFKGGKGNETFKGGDGNDTGNGGKGKDKLLLGKGNDKGNGGDGDDVVDGGDGIDVTHGDAGNDKVFCGAGGKEKAYGDAGNDVVNCRDGKPGDTINGGAGKNDTCIGDKGDIFIGCETIVKFKVTKPR